jgi:hypothetical protein
MVTIMKRLLVKAQNVSQVDTDLEVSNEISLHTKQSAIWKQSAELQENGEYHCLIKGYPVFNSKGFLTL